MADNFRTTVVGGIALGRPGSLQDAAVLAGSHDGLSFIRLTSQPHIVHEIDTRKGTIETFVQGKCTVNGDTNWQWHFDEIHRALRSYLSTTNPKFNQQQEMFQDGQDQDQ